MDPAQRLVGVRVSFLNSELLLKDQDAGGFQEVLRLTNSV